MTPQHNLPLVARGQAMVAAMRQFGRALSGRPAHVALARPAIADFTPLLWGGRRMTPDQVRWVLEQAAGGNIQEQWALFDLMEDTWPRLTKNLNEIRRAAARTTYTAQPYAERGMQPTDTARARADLVETALRNWRPRPGTLELSFEEALYNALDALGKGLSVLEITWQRTDEGLLPRCAHLLHPRRYGWNADGNELGLVHAGDGNGGAQVTWKPFPPGQFTIGIWHSRSGAPGQTALLRCLAPYWVGVTFGWEWLLANAQIFGVPIRWGTYDAARPELRDQLAAMLANLGSAGWAAFPSGTTLDFKEAISRSTDNPQVMIQTMADKACDLLILGQEASSESKPAGLGAGASQLHGAVRADRLQDAAQWCADLLNYQLVPALLAWNWGDTSEPPTLIPDTAAEIDPKAKADRDLILTTLGLRIPLAYMYERHAIPAPEDGEETVGGPTSTTSGANPFGPSNNGRPTSGSAPWGSDPTESGAAKSPQKAGRGATNTQMAARGANARVSNPPRSAVGRSGTSVGDGAATKPVLPGDYKLPETAQQALAAAHARDFDPLRLAAEPLLAAIESGNLDVIGELEAFIALLDELAPGMIGASELATALEAALAEAALAGAVQSYGKLPENAEVSQVTTP